MTHRRPGGPALRHFPRLQAAPAQRHRVRGAAQVKNLASSRGCWPASEVPCEGVRFRLATARDAIHRRASLRMPAQVVDPSVRLRATLRPVLARARTTLDVLRAKRLCVSRALHDDTRRRLAPSTPTTLRPLRAAGIAFRRAQSGTPRECSAREMRV